MPIQNPSTHDGLSEDSVLDVISSTQFFLSSCMLCMVMTRDKEKALGTNSHTNSKALNPSKQGNNMNQSALYNNT